MVVVYLVQKLVTRPPVRAGDGWLLFTWHRKQVTYVLQTDDCCLPGTENRQTKGPPVRAGYKWLLFIWHRKQVNLRAGYEWLLFTWHRKQVN